MCRTRQMHARCFCVRGRACCAAGVCALGVLRAFCGVLCSAFLGALGVLSVLCKLYICCFAGRCRCAWCMILRFAVAFACHFLSHSRIARSLFLHEYYKQISAIRVLYPSFVLLRQNGLFVCGRTGCVYWLRLLAWFARLRRTGSRTWQRYWLLGGSAARTMPCRSCCSTSIVFAGIRIFEHYCTSTQMVAAVIPFMSFDIVGKGPKREKTPANCPL